MSGFSSYVPISIADYERWKRIKTQFQDFNPGLLEVSNLQNQIKAAQNDPNLSTSEKLRISDNLETRVESILKSLPRSVGATRAAKEAAEHAAAAAEPGGDDVEDAEGDEAEDGEADISEPQPGKKIDTSTYKKLRNYFGSPLKMGIPGKHAALYHDLLKHMALNHERIGVDTKRRLVIDGNVVPDSDAADLVRCMFKENKSLHSRGLKRFVRVLWETYLQKRFFATDRVQGHLRSQGLMEDKSEIFQDPAELESEEPLEKGEEETSFQSFSKEAEKMAEASTPKVAAKAKPLLNPVLRPKAVPKKTKEMASVSKEKGTSSKGAEKATSSKEKGTSSLALAPKQTAKGLKHVKLDKPSGVPPGKRRRRDSSRSSSKKRSTPKRDPLVLRLYR